MSRLGVVRADFEPPTESPRSATDPVVAEQERQQRVRGLREERSELQAIAGEKSLRARLERLAHDTAVLFAPPPLGVPRGKVRDDTVEETLLLMLSDWHAYEEVDRERTRGFNVYNADVFGARVRKVVDSAISIKQRMERGQGWRFPKLVVSCNGDFVSGTIHELERHTDAPSIVHAVYGCAMVLAETIRDLSAHFPAVEVFCTPGNHGRLPDAKRMQQKDPSRNWDTLIALWVQSMLRQVGHVQFFIPNSYSVAFDVEGWRFLQTHGHDVKSWNSIPWYGLNRLVGNLNALESSRGTTIHHYLFGHFHEASSLPHAAGESFINGSLIGGNEFTMNAMAKMGRPRQWLLGVHKEHGVSHRWPLVADGTTADSPRYVVKPWLAA